MTRLTAVLVGLGVAVLTAGCSGSTRPAVAAPPMMRATTAPSAALAAPSATSPDATEQASAAALATYRKVQETASQEFATNRESPDLISYVSGNAFLFFRQALTWQIDHYIVQAGTPQSAPVVTGVKLVGTPSPYVTITDCFGGPGYTSVFATDVDGYKKGQSAVVPGTSVAPHVVTAIVEDHAGTWLVINYTPSAQRC